MPVFANIVAYQLAWFACVLGAAYRYTWIGTATAVVVAVAHVALSHDRRTQVKLILCAAALGWLVDNVLMQIGAIRFQGTAQILETSPLWMTALWMAFATTFTVSLRWLMVRPAWAMMFGAVGGPVAYYAGMKLGALTVPTYATGLGAVAIAWTIAMGLLALVVRRLARHGDAEAAS